MTPSSAGESDGITYVQLDTYGSCERHIPGKVSQSIQLDESGAAELTRIFGRAFSSLP
jgi:hypothetical protein